MSTPGLRYVVVCVKQIPDPAAPGALDPATNTLKREGKLILDESDSYGVEMALQLVDAAGGGEVSLVSMAPNGETSGLRTALAMGAAKAVLVSDPELQGSDALTTAKVLAKAIERLDGADLVIAATESTDGYTGTVPEQIAELLGRPSVTFAKHIEVADGTLKVQRQTEEGYDEVTCPLPAVVSVTAGVVEPRYPSFKGIMAAKSKPVDQVTAADLGVTPAGWAGAGQKIVDVAAGRGPPGRRDRRGRRRGLRQGRRLPRGPQGHLRAKDYDRTWPSTPSGSSPSPPTALPTTGTLELLTKARSLGAATVAAFHGGGTDAAGAAAALGAHGATKVYATGRPGRAATRPRGRGRHGRDHRRRGCARPDPVPPELRGS